MLLRDERDAASVVGARGEDMKRRERGRTIRNGGGEQKGGMYGDRKRGKENSRSNP